ncbi:dynamin family protein [uncultured Helicobacter sp.]|uniref:dynamin family protein n=1 Tax=uncultured Helicobacter sp. TaxID=175537 RepID=UPI00258BC435|nr:dynamin family protein [uncultured Helicobacter sp.]
MNPTNLTNPKNQSTQTTDNAKNRAQNAQSAQLLYADTLLEDFIKECIAHSQNPLENHINQTKYILTQTAALSQSAKHTLNELVSLIDSPIKIAVIGQFSSGKSTFLNAILGQKILPSGITPVTAKVCEICYGQTLGLEVFFANNTTTLMPLEFLNNTNKQTLAKISHFKLYAPVEILRSITFLDTPGFNSQNESDTKTTNEILKQADGIIWLSLIDNVGKNSEKEILHSHIQKYATKSICVLNQKDRLKNEDEIQTSLKYANEAFSGLFSHIVAISAKQAQDHARKAESNIQAVLDFLYTQIIPNASSYKPHRILKQLQALTLQELYMTHKYALRLQELQSYLSLQNAQIKFDLLQTHLQDEFDALFRQYDAQLENLSLKIFNALREQEIEFSIPHKSAFGLTKLHTLKQTITTLPKDEILSLLTHNENQTIRDLRKLRFQISNFGKSFECFLHQELQTFQETFHKWLFQVQKYTQDNEQPLTITLTKDYQNASQKALFALQSELETLSHLLIINYQNAIELALEKIDAKITFALKKHKENPKEFALWIPTFENIRDFINQGFHYGLYQDKLFLTNSLYKKMLFNLSAEIEIFYQHYATMLAQKLADLAQKKQNLKAHLKVLRDGRDLM